jgi:hypothetical protein
MLGRHDAARVQLVGGPAELGHLRDGGGCGRNGPGAGRRHPDRRLPSGPAESISAGDDAGRRRTACCTCIGTAQWGEDPFSSPRSDLVTEPERPTSALDDSGHPPGDDSTAGLPDSLWARMKADPQYAPEHLALEAVRRLGPEAQRWAHQARAAQPGTTPEALARAAVKRFTQHARLSGAVAGAAGLPGAVVDVGVLAWTQSRMVLHVAAAYDEDPTHPDRAADLLVLQRVHKVAETARLALGVAAGRERANRLFAAGDRPLTGTMAKLGLKLAQMAGVKAAKTMFAKVIPGASIVLGTWANSAATKDLARRAQEHYRSA